MKYKRILSNMLFGLFLFSILPIVVSAKTTITTTSVEGPKEASIGDTISLKFNVRFSGLDKTNTDTEGLLGVILKFSIDSDGLIPQTFASAWDTEVEYEDNAYVVGSVLKENMNQTCQDGVTVCGDYQLELKFFVDKTSAENFNITMDEVYAVTLLSELVNEDITEKIVEDKANLLEYTTPSTFAIKIANEKTDDPIVAPPALPSSDKELDASNIILKTIPTTTTEAKNEASSPASSTPAPVNPSGSSNNKLSRLEVKDYELSFYPDKEHYSLIVDKDVNSLNITVELEDEKASYTIEGADDLKKADNQIKIEVTAENGQKKAYTIDAVVNEKKKEWFPGTIKIFDYEIKKSYLVYGGIALGVVIVLVMLKVIFRAIGNKFSNRKIKKALKQIEKK